MKREIKLNDLSAYTHWGNNLEGFREWAVTLGHYTAVAHADSYIKLVNTREEEKMASSVSLESSQNGCKRCD